MDNSNSFRRVACPMENVSTTFQSLDTVRALHQTVVSLRSALEDAKFEIQRLRSQISVQSDIKDSAKLQNPSKVYSPRTKTTKLDKNDRNIQQEISTSPPEKSETSKTIKAYEQQQSDIDILETPEDPTFPEVSERKPNNILQQVEHRPKVSIIPEVSIIAHPRSDDVTKRMASKIDVKIKVLSNIKVEGVSGHTSSGSQSSSARSRSSEQEHDSADKFKLQAISEDKLTVTRAKSDGAFSTAQENVIMEDMDTSQSDGDNSVFYEEKNESNTSQKEKSFKEKDRESKEEVDDIELIFSSDENREIIQEDMVSISEYDPWHAVGSTGTPVLVKFSSLQSEQDVTSQTSNIKLPASTSQDVFFDQQKSLESSDSFTKSSSLDKDNSEEPKEEPHSIGRDESLDFFDYRDSAAIGRKWTNYNVLVETDISKCGIIEETTFEMYRRNTCPNPPAYRPIIHRESIITTRHIPPRIASKYSRRIQQGHGAIGSPQSPRPVTADKTGQKKSSAAQTEISALPDHWKSESQLTDGRYHVGGPCTLPSKFVPTNIACHKHSLRNSDRTQEARRVLLSDINFTSMVPELSRSADHLCQDEGQQDINKPSSRYYKGNHLKTPDYALKGMTPSVSMTSPGVSQWTVNESSFGTQTIQTGESWGKRMDSFDSCKSYSAGSRFSGLDRNHRSRSVPSIRCAICKLAHGNHGIRTSESMHYTPRVTFQEPACKIRGSLPDLRHDCMCSRRFAGRTIFTIHGDSSGSTESLLDEADTFVRKSMESAILTDDFALKKPNPRRMSENDIQRDYAPSKQSLPFLPKTAKCLKPGHLAKVISKNGRVVVGRVKYVGPLATIDKDGASIADDLYVGVQLQSKCGDCDGTFEGRKFFDCEPLQGLFVPFKKVVMAWTG